MLELTGFLFVLVLILWALSSLFSKSRAPAAKALEGKQVAILIEEKFNEEQYVAFSIPLKREGATLKILSLEAKAYKSSSKTEVALAVSAEMGGKFHGLLIPESDGLGKLRTSADILRFIRGLSEKGGIIVAIGRAVCVLISTDILKKRRATCSMDILDDLKNAGAIIPETLSIVADGNLITAKGSTDLVDLVPTFIDALKSK